jgi:hypothetical protein
MSDLERALLRLASDVDYPATPPIARAVSRQLQAEGRRRAGRRATAWRRVSARTAILAAALVLLVAGVVAAAVPSVREDVLRLVGLRGATIERVPALPPDVRRHLGKVLGPPTTLGAARARLSFDPFLPHDLGAPEGVFSGGENAPPGGELSLTFAPGAGLPRSKYTGVGLLVNEVDGRLAPGTFGKLMPPSARADRFRIDGHLALWISGLHGIYRLLHGYYYKDSRHAFRIGRLRLTGNALLVQRGPVLVRLEGEFDLIKAIAVARGLSVR